MYLDDDIMKSGSTNVYTQDLNMGKTFISMLMISTENGKRVRQKFSVSHMRYYQPPGNLKVNLNLDPYGTNLLL